MANIWLISDTHFNHNKDFIWRARGFNSIEEMNEAIIYNWNKKVQDDDIVYHLGDLIMGDLDEGLEKIKQLKGKIRLTIGNHDTNKRLAAFSSLPNIEDIQFGYRLTKGKKTFMLTHFPLLTDNYDKGKVYSFHGHTHSKNPFCERPCMYNVNCDAHSCSPILFEDAVFEIVNKNF